ncbi:MAG TPA: MAC/perforin domain-containing protein [Gaiellaceae bacterium]|nr:MAC/perforin domain-containing protein [Gaiellaceae bacterium]
MSTTLQTRKQQPSRVRPHLPGTDVVGFGYDATGQYADVESRTLPLFDLGAYVKTVSAPNGRTYAIPNAVKVQLGDLTEGSFSATSGKSIRDYQESLSAAVGVSGSYGLFSGSLSTTYSREQRASIAHDFVTVRHVFRGWIVSLGDWTRLTILPRVSRDLETALTPEAAIAKYGTHFVVNAVVGGRAEYSAFVDTTRFSIREDLEVVAQMAYKAAVGQIDAEARTRWGTQLDTFNEAARTQLSTVGGDFTEPLDPSSYAYWMNAFRKHPVLVDFTPRSLVEIWQLVDKRNRKRRAALKRAAAEYIESAASRVIPNIPALEVLPATGLDLVATDAGSRARMDLAVYKPKLPEGYYWMGQTANKKQGILVRELVPGALAPPLGFDMAWNDAGSRASKEYALWNIVPPPHYRALGAIARLGTSGWAPPSGSEIEGLRCVHESLCTRGRTDPHGLIWNDGGTWAKADGSVWPILPADEGGVSAHTFVSHRGYDVPTEPLWAIARNERVEEVTASGG